MVTVPTVVSTFAGCGGSSLGYALAGFRELLAIEWNARAIEMFKLNFKNVPAWQRDVTTVSATEIMDAVGIGEGELDVLDGSPPCQGFSLSGDRNIGDPRNSLFSAFCDLLAGLKPKAFVMENVPGMSYGKMKGMFNIILDELRSRGYAVECRKMNAMWHGVPQSRQRLIFIGARNDLSVVPTFPGPSTERPITVAEALTGCGPGVAYEPARTLVVWKYISRIRAGESGSKYHHKGHFFNLRRLYPNRPSPTIPKNAGRNIIHPTENRFISDAEGKRLCGFPDDFILVGSAIDRLSVLGNAVPPPLMRDVAAHVKSSILDKAGLRTVANAA